MIRMATLSELHRQAHSLGLYCAACDRWHDADLDALVRAGFGQRPLAETRFRCRDCGLPAEKQVRPPESPVTHASRYVAIP